MSSRPGPSVDLDRERMTACLDMIGRTGAQGVQIRWSEDEEPTVWFAVAVYRVNREGRPVSHGAGRAHKVGAALHPNVALEKLLDEAIDGGVCTHCHRPTGVTHDFEGEMPDRGLLLCWYRWDPELKTYRRSCEGERDR